MYEDVSPHVNLDDKYDARQDDYSILFLLKAQDQPVATVRATPATSEMTLLGRLQRLPEDLAKRDDVVEVSRVAGIPKSDGIPYSLLVLVGGARWLLAQTKFKYFFAYCRLPLVRMYRFVGAQKRGNNFTINGSGNLKFTLVEGSLGSAAAVSTPPIELVTICKPTAIALGQK
jgi:hypothetical protein